MGSDYDKTTHRHVEIVDDHSLEPDLLKPADVESEFFDGDVNLSGPGDIVYLIPTPSPDPRDPLNLSVLRKLIVLAIVALYSSVGLTMVSGLGALLGTFIPVYVAEGRTVADITHLMTYPTLFMGIGNIFGMPLALAVGRRPVFLVSSVVLVVACILCATQKSYEWHLASRMILGLAAGQSEALCPLMVQETFFLHERGKYQMIFSAAGNILTTIFTLLTSYIGKGIGSEGWYGLGAGLSALVLVISIFLLPETKYDRPLSAYQGQAARVSTFAAGDREDGQQDESYTARRLSTRDVRELDSVNYKPRTLASDMRLFVNKPDWEEGFRTLRRMCTIILFPDILWAFLLNGLTLGVNVAMATTYGNILSAVPYSWAQENISFAMTGQIVVSLVALPALGWGSDWAVKLLARRNGGVHQPQYRLVTLVFPILVGVLSAVLYGEAAQHPYRLHWFAIVFAVNAYYFAFVGANQAGIVYALDSYPTRSGPALVVICAGRGILSFGTSYAVQPFIGLKGYDGAFIVYGILTGVFGAIGILVYTFSARIRAFCSRYAVQTSETKPTYS
ncbi:Major facilitator superfamily transporter [Pleurostoma richardsiae]|uniref:Major facilitator superfamily transporter n=1 Tax=Pleurostoma richardsiae TaxID=41990 RepID=A0AA38VQ13_9PEZI|nr:Major facilitator superfamily transporter [Pleurostoma richardsiae]